MNKKSSLAQKLCTSPHIVWSAIFIVVPLIMVVYYAFTNKGGEFSFSNVQKFLSDKTNIDVLDLIIDEIMKVAVARY